MFKKIVAVAIVVAAVVVNYVQQQRVDALARAYAREALQSEITMGMAPMSWTCKRFEMTLSVNDNGETICAGMPRWSAAEPMSENVAAFHLMEECSASNGAARLDGTVQAGAPALAVRCVGTRFEERWQAAK